MTAARRLQTEERDLLPGRVILVDRDRLSVVLEDGGEVVARRAASCLLAPEPGDRVLVAPMKGEAFVLAVLERDGSKPATLRLDGNARLETTGRLGLVAKEGIDLVSATEVNVTTGSLDVKARSGSLTFARVIAVAQSALANVDELGVVAKTCDFIAERVMQKAQRVYRFVEEYEQLRARHIDYRAEQMAQIRGENTVIVARQIAKMDGEQVHIG